MTLHIRYFTKFDSFCCVHVTQGASAAVTTAMLLHIFFVSQGTSVSLLPHSCSRCTYGDNLFFLETIHCSFSCSSQNFFVSSHFRVQLWLLVIYFGWRYVLLLCILLFLIFYIVIEWLGITLFPFFNCPWVLTNVTFLFVFVNIACACFRCLFVSCIYVCRSGDLQGQGCQFNSRWLIHSHRGRCRYHVLWPRDIVLVEGWGRAGLKGRDGGLEGGWIVLSKT
jgi:hypothetical protein